MPLLEGRHNGRKILLPAVVLDIKNPNDLSFVAVTALLDTGATGGAISPTVVEKLNLAPYEKRYLKVATEDRLVNYYFYRIGLHPDNGQPGALTPQLPYIFAEVDGFEMQKSADFDIIIGMNVLSQCDFRMTRNGNWALKFG